MNFVAFPRSQPRLFSAESETIFGMTVINQFSKQYFYAFATLSLCSSSIRSELKKFTVTGAHYFYK